MARKMLSVLCAGFFIFALLFTGQAALAAGKTVKYRFSTASFPGLPTHTATIKYAELVKEKSGGRIIINPIQERKMGSDKDNIEMVGAGAVEMGHASTAVFDGFFQDLNALQMPFLINSYDELQKVYLADYTKTLLKKLESINLHPLGLIENGYRHLGNNVRSINTPADMKGIKLRVAESKMHQEIFKAMGAIPIPISYGEIYTSLKTGVINGTEINATSAASEKLMEVIKYFSMTGHFFWPSVGFVNKGLWDKMPPEDQKILQEAWLEMIPWQIDLCKGRDAKALETMKKRGIVINQGDAKALLDQAKPIYDKYMKVPEIAEFVGKVKAMK
jgi:tripartite ATP-independent transporter DctP family solute receptor